MEIELGVLVSVLLCVSVCKKFKLENSLAVKPELTLFYPLDSQTILNRALYESSLGEVFL